MVEIRLHVLTVAVIECNRDISPIGLGTLWGTRLQLESISRFVPLTQKGPRFEQ
jgi:hypothetical protein